MARRSSRGWIEPVESAERRKPYRITDAGRSALSEKTWRRRYGEEVADLVEARPARVRTVLDQRARRQQAEDNQRRGGQG
ncbi:hypothetical protein [Nonomuraea rhodomycinica]|uniref:Uncharacterized protein n=1 Tax=Nonomuraea rhodomycinica TaxID=1712872 RepID=A0A7Y6IYZ3_9ACTN|nr:hypothetical protein [Nonomuraea rhodomycinica]NUW46618.1 hypothetical protein [Nonomuraea rhodomycinica]